VVSAAHMRLRTSAATAAAAITASGALLLDLGESRRIHEITQVGKQGCLKPGGHLIAVCNGPPGTPPMLTSRTVKKRVMIETSVRTPADPIHVRPAARGAAKMATPAAVREPA